MLATPPVSLQPTAPRQILRDYQERAIEGLRQHIRQGCRRLLLVLPTGAGKTSVAAAMIEGAVAKGKRVHFWAHRLELITQASQRLAGLGIEHGIIMADHPSRRQWASVHVASVQTLRNRQQVQAPDLIFLDEAHRARAKTYSEILKRYPNAVVVGLTATPIRTDGKGLGHLFERMVCGPSVAELTSMGYLVPARIFAPSKPDTTGIKLTGGDYNQGQLSMVMDKPTITGDAVAHWLKLGENRQTVAFCVDVNHSKHVRDQFLAAHIPSAHLDGETPTREREGLLADLASGRIRVLCSVGVLTEGWDSPIVSCCLMLRPTKSLGLHLQMCGRVLRPYPGKEDCIVLDHAGNTLRHGMIDDERDWELGKDRKQQQGPAIDLNVNVPKVCPKCFRVYGRTVTLCEPCNYRFFVAKRDGPRQVDGELRQVAAGERYRRIPDDKRRDLYLRWAREGAERGWKPTAALMKYQSMFHCDPEDAWIRESLGLTEADRLMKPGELRIAR